MLDGALISNLRISAGITKNGHAALDEIAAYKPVPEVGATMLGGLGALGLLRRLRV